MYSSSFMCVSEPGNVWSASHCEVLGEYTSWNGYLNKLAKSPRWSFLKCFQIFMGLWETYKDHLLSRKKTNVIWRKIIFLTTQLHQLGEMYWYYLHVDMSKNGFLSTWGLQICSGIYQNPNSLLQSYICLEAL